MIDKRKRYICIIDCETVGRPFHNKAREVGALMVDKRGVVYDTREWMVQEVFLPSKNKRKLAPTAAQAIQEELKELLECYKCETLAGYNARYDRVALQNIGVQFPTAEWWDIHKMAKSVIVPRKTYQRFCDKHGYLTKAGQPKSTAEVVGRYLKQNVGYIQDHSGLPDCELESQIMAACIRQHKKMRGVGEMYPAPHKERKKDMKITMDTMVAVRFSVFEGSAYCPPCEYQFLGFYIPGETDLKRFDGDIAVYLDEDEIEFLTTLGMVNDSNYPALMIQVDNAVEEWWKDNMETIESYYGLDGDAF